MISRGGGENNICKFLEWDSQFFNVRIARLLSQTLTEETLNSAFSWCRENKIDCLYFLADPEDKKTVKLAEQNDFNLTDIRITLETRLEDAFSFDEHDQNSIYPASQADIEQLKQIASVSHRDSRFYYDGNFPEQKCDELFAVWIEKSCGGFADAVLVAKSGEIVEGYITCSVDDEGKGSIGLVGVNPDRRGKGVGKHLVNSALEWFANNNVTNVRVVTQGRNIKAQRLYQRNGFVTGALELWYHLWFL